LEGRSLGQQLFNPALELLREGPQSDCLDLDSSNLSLLSVEGLDAVLGER
jgi:hypothetical protein